MFQNIVILGHPLQSQLVDFYCDTYGGNHLITTKKFLSHSHLLISYARTHLQYMRTT